jgi:HPt (histidine-containing phosphotransfer) domain-containing protein
MSDTPSIDPVALQRLQRLGGAAFVGKMIDLFISYVVEKLAEARAAGAAGNCVGVANAVHPVKSSAGNVGAVQVQALAQQIEQLAKQGQAAALPGLLDDLTVAFGLAKTALEEHKRTLTGEPS